MATTATTDTTTITYRRTKSGEWVAYGPAALVHGTIVVTKKDGTRKVEQVARRGKTFIVDGVEMVYGYLARRRTESTERCYRGHTHPVDGCRDCFDLWDM